MVSEQHLPPTPRALSDAELQEVLDRAKAEGGGILAAMQILEAQAQLRETDKSELRAWQSQQADIGSEEEIATSLDEELTPVVVSVEPVALESQDEAVPIIEIAIEPIVDTPIEVVVQTKRLAKDPSSSQFWVWLPISGSLLPFGMALWLRSLGLTFEQSLTAVLLGIFASAGVVAVGAIAGKRSSLPTMVLSRAAFGVFGNLGPALILVVSRLFWALVLVTLGYLLIAQNLTSTSSMSGGSEPVSWVAVLVLAVVVLGSAVLSSLGGRFLIWAQRVFAQGF